MEQFAGVFHCFRSFSIAVLNYPKGITRAVGFYMALSMAEKKHKIWPCKNGDYSKHGANIDVHRSHN